MDVVDVDVHNEMNNLTDVPLPIKILAPKPHAARFGERSKTIYGICSEIHTLNR